ncbi:uncharacterized protein LOC132978677 isoform X2 [Labrus mixtus]|uniref:uncharacterized protein LOC132978677 isoform X2 n=1 Tax=Labrus mixtus TaxID=508554 RepID=UPI0029C0DA95|nr:uncharacterized protein LOC132978677 isoform X2 [Labrus mixtus]
MPSLSEDLQEVRSRAEVCLYSGGRVVEVRAGVMAMANLSLPPCSKYRHIAAETMVTENSFGSNRKETLASLQRLSTALNILEKYGCNLTNPNRPKYWRTVKHNNPVFRATVDAIQETHPHPEFYERIIPTLRHKDVGLNTDAVIFQSSSSSGHSKGQTKSLAFPLHHHSSRKSSHSLSIQVSSTSSNKHPG